MYVISINDNKLVYVLNGLGLPMGLRQLVITKIKEKKIQFAPSNYHIFINFFNSELNFLEILIFNKAFSFFFFSNHKDFRMIGQYEKFLPQPSKNVRKLMDTANTGGMHHVDRT